ncbi:MAG: DNA-directed RNA polymerase subunit omega [Bacteroidetes bacterium RIFCSPLOWO2_02_FULL_36_8]|nr:MAG: DNA-directed RNA polymerase subunit omega [Bacteroidetes bacterium RIFCSPLOWO2_02_FULL_36_8]OFY70990.1 MAG: DNA-directed RNA polymerase subunit omega [Bacteroidetes bacterium RIFCSPLOWO2_12_FULL_37_12]
MLKNTSIITRDTRAIEKETGNIYESISAIAKRARQISQHYKEELNDKLKAFDTSLDTLDEIQENKEQIEISRHYEKMSKPTQMAIEEYLDGKLVVKYPDREEN